MIVQVVLWVQQHVDIMGFCTSDNNDGSSNKVACAIISSYHSKAFCGEISW